MRKIEDEIHIDTKEFQEIMDYCAHPNPLGQLLEGIAEQSVIQGVENVEETKRVVIDMYPERRKVNEI